MSESKSDALPLGYEAINKSGGGSWIRTMEPEGTDLQSAAFDHFANPPKISGADRGSRTPNLLITSQLRCQLRYVGKKMVGDIGLEPMTPCL